MISAAPQAVGDLIIDIRVERMLAQFYQTSPRFPTDPIKLATPQWAADDMEVKPIDKNKQNARRLSLRNLIEAVTISSNW